MKKIVLIVFHLCFVIPLFAQDDNLVQQDSSELEKEALLIKNVKKIKMVANYRFTLNSTFNDFNYSNTKFTFNELRFDIFGSLNKKVHYRFRSNFASFSAPQTQDRIFKYIDFAFVDYHLSDKVHLLAGKLAPEIGSYEFDFNPIYMYQYNNFVNYGELFLSGITAKFFINKNHSLSLQAVNSSTKSFSELYPNIQTAKATKIPIASNINWRGSFFNKHFNTIWSYGFINEANNRFVNRIFLGNEFSFEKIKIHYDFKFSDEQIDKLGVITSRLKQIYSDTVAQNTRYIENWLRLDINSNKYSSFSLMGMSSSEYFFNKNISNFNSKKPFSNTYGGSFAIEVHPFENKSMRFFTSFLLKHIEVNKTVRTGLGIANQNTYQIQIGMYCPLLMF